MAARGVTATPLANDKSTSAAHVELSSKPELPAPRRLAAAIPRSGVDAMARLALRQYLADGDRDLAGAFRSGVAALDLVRARSEQVERALLHTWRAWLGDAPEAALIAVGGFGRRELFPHSDVDLLVLTGAQPEPRLLRGIEQFMAGLWDIGIKPGHAVRSVESCIAFMRDDVSVYTNLLDARPLDGDAELARSLFSHLPDPRTWPAQRFLHAKRAEQIARHQRFGGTAYNLEPNIKESPGGLRDLQLIDWLGRVMAADHAIAAGGELLDSDERIALERARTALYRIRYALHLLAGRAEERLLFDYQRTLALSLGYDDGVGNLAVEKFMQGYFRAVSRIAAANDDELGRCAELLAPEPGPSQKLSDGIVRIGNQVDFADSDLPRNRPETMVSLYLALAGDDTLVDLRASAKRAIRAALADAKVDLDRAEVHAQFRQLLDADVSVAVAAIAGLARCGVLARLIPAFAQVSGRMQYDLFHVYTVDEHTLRVLGFIARFSETTDDKTFALARTVFPRIAQPGVLLIAALFHDIAKGRDGDHSELGENEARTFCARLDLAPGDTDLVAWLVRRHLLMSATAQRQDITDAEAVHRFASEVGDWERLDYLYLLTVADICGTSPKLWNSWRDRLLADLYAAARYVLREHRDEPPLLAERAATTRDRARLQLVARGVAAATIEDIWADFPQRSFLRYRAEQIAWQTEALASSPELPLVRMRGEGSRGASEIFVCARDRDGLFATVTAVIDRMHLNVVEARIITSMAGRALNTFMVLDGEGRTLKDLAHIAEVEQVLTESLRDPDTEVAVARRSLPRTLRHFRVAPRIDFRIDPGTARTRFSLFCSDRPGLLAAVAQALHACNVHVHDARIATFGERVEDFFEVTDSAGAPLDGIGEAALVEAVLQRVEPESLKQTNEQTGIHNAETRIAG
ncbi:MAG: [protein-PII] uridylyltransferase [Dokdonella sp.]